MDFFLGQLQGYNAETGQYLEGGQPASLPKNPFILAVALPSDYDNIGNLPENWAKYGEQFIGSTVGFKDWMCLRAPIRDLIYSIAGTDFVDWNNLTAEQKQIALKFVPTKIIDQKGTTFFVTEAGGETESKNILDNYQKLSQEARSKRLKAFGDFGYYGLGKEQGLQLERKFQVLALDRVFVIRGVLFESEDAISGLGDWVQGFNGYDQEGLKPLLDLGTFTLVNGFPYTIAQFCDILTYNILENGEY